MIRPLINVHRVGRVWLDFERYLEPAALKNAPALSTARMFLSVPTYQESDISNGLAFQIQIWDGKDGRQGLPGAPFRASDL